MYCGVVISRRQLLVHSVRCPAPTRSFPCLSSAVQDRIALLSRLSGLMFVVITYYVV